MTVQWCVVLDTGGEVVVYGPTEDADTAGQFAEYLTAEVDPARPAIMRSVTRELLAGWRNHDQRKDHR